jgi:hypothetical protein
MNPSTPLEPADNVDAEPQADVVSVPPATSATTGDLPEFGWSAYAERVNGRFAMLGFSAVVLIETLSRDSFLHWAGLVP